MALIKEFSEFDNTNINWSEIETKWNDHTESTNGEDDYDEEFFFLKKTCGNPQLPWDEIEGQYFDYINSSNNEDDYDEKFQEFKRIVTENQK